MHKHVTDLKAEFECKDEDDSVGTFSGVASTSDLDKDNDVIQNGAFDPIPMRRGPSGDIPNVLMLRDHDRSQIIGGWHSFKQSGNQLLVEGELCLDVPKARETHTLMKRGYISGLSVCFTVSDPKHIAFSKGHRVIKKATLRECSIVGFPANPNAQILSVKSEVDAWLVERGFQSGDLESLLRQMKQNGDPPAPKSGEDRPTYLKRCLRATGGDMEGCHSTWDDYDEEEKAFDQHLLDPVKWISGLLDKEERPTHPWGDVEYADPGYREDDQGRKIRRYPIDVKWRIRAAWNRIHQAANRAFYTRDQLDAIEARIVRAWKKKIDPDGPPAYQEAQGKSETPLDENDAEGFAAQMLARVSKRARS